MIGFEGWDLAVLVVYLAATTAWGAWLGRGQTGGTDWSFERSDEIFARFIVEEMPVGLTGLLIAGVFAAAMSSLSSSINSLASATAYDFWAPATGREKDERAVLRMGKFFTLAWAALLIAGAIAFIPLSRGNTAVEVALGIQSLVYGGLLGGFALGLLVPRADERSVMMGMASGIGTVTPIWLTARSEIAWPWFVLIGSLGYGRRWERLRSGEF